MLRDKVLDAITSTATSSTIFPTRKTSGDTIVVQVHISGSASVAIEGRCGGASDDPWVTMDTLASSDAVAVIAMPEMRLTATISSATVSAWVAE